MRIAERYELAAEMRERYAAAGKRLRGNCWMPFAWPLATTASTRWRCCVAGVDVQSRFFESLDGAATVKTFASRCAALGGLRLHLCRTCSHSSDSLPRSPLIARSTSLAATEELLLSASVSTVRRNLRTMRDTRLGPAAAAAATRLRREVPVKLRGQKVLDRPGFMEIDLVSHSGRGQPGAGSTPCRRLTSAPAE